MIDVKGKTIDELFFLKEGRTNEIIETAEIINPGEKNIWEALRLSLECCSDEQEELAISFLFGTLADISDDKELNNAELN